MEPYSLNYFSFLQPFGRTNSIISLDSCSLSLSFLSLQVHKLQLSWFISNFVLKVNNWLHLEIVETNSKSSDYHWWWRSFIVGGGSGFYVLLYSVFYFFTKLEISSFVPCLLYFGYTCLITITFSCFTGTVSFYSSYIFINKIYGQIKID